MLKSFVKNGSKSERWLSKVHAGLIQRQIYNE